MKNSDFKHIVKESLRDAFYTKKDVTDSPKFKSWFGNSKVVNSQGKPLRVYHGTNADFSSFDPKKSGTKSNTGAPEGTFFFTNKPDVASSYTIKWQGDFSQTPHDNSNTMPVYLSMKSPLKLNAKGDNWRNVIYNGEYRDINEILELIKNSGKYDGLIVSNVIDKGVGNVSSKNSTTYVVFKPTQIKSAIGNNGEFNTNDSDILKESVNAHKITVMYYDQLLPAIISKNTIPGEKPYRVSIFKKIAGEMRAEGHFDLTQQEAQEILDNGKLPDDLYRTYQKIGIVSTDGWFEKKGDHLVPIKEGVLNEGLFGQKLYLLVPGLKIQAIITKNTKPNESEYRLTWFGGDDSSITKGHAHFDKNTLDAILKRKQLTPRLREFVSSILHCNPSQLKAEFVDKFDGTLQETLNEELYGKKLKVKYFGDECDGVLSKNTKPNELPYRITWFTMVGTDRLSADGHMDITEEEVAYVLKNKQFPPTVYERIRISPKNLTISQMNESLLLLEDSSRELDLWLENKVVITESMSMVVSGADYKRTDKLDDLVNLLQDTVVSPTLRKMTDEQEINYFHKNSVGFWNLLTADGSYYAMQTGNPALGTINLYPGGITSKYLRPILTGILRQLKKLGIKWGQLKREPSGAYKFTDVIRIPIIENNSKGYGGPAQLNFTNINAYQLFHNVLQYEGEDSFTMESKDLMERIETILKHDPSWIDKNIIKKSDSDWPEAERDTEEPIENPHADMMNKIGNQLGGGGARIIGGGLDSDDIKFRLLEIWKVAKWAVDNGHKQISVG